MMEPSTRVLHSIPELEELVQELWRERSPRTVWLLEGPVGSGKTETVKALVRRLGAAEAAASPSFAIHHRYPLNGGLFIDHLDLYRIKSEEDLESTGFWDLFSEDEGFVIIEWADLLNPGYLPRNWDLVRLSYAVISPTEREVRWEKVRP